MEMNITAHTLNTIVNALRCAETDLKRQTNIYKGWRLENAQRQLMDVQDALYIMEQYEDEI